MSAIVTAIIPEETIYRIEALLFKMQVKAAEESAEEAKARPVRPVGRPPAFVYKPTDKEMEHARKLARSGKGNEANKYLDTLRKDAEQAHRTKQLEELHALKMKKLQMQFGAKTERVSRVSVINMLLKEALDARDEKKAADA